MAADWHVLFNVIAVESLWLLLFIHCLSLCSVMKFLFQCFVLMMPCSTTAENESLKWRP